MPIHREWLTAAGTPGLRSRALAAMCEASTAACCTPARAVPLCARRRPAARPTPRPRHRARSETYQYYTLPFCQPEEGKKYVLEDLGEVLEGDRLVSTPYEIKFLQDMEDEELCTKTLNMRDLAKLRLAITRDYYFQVGSWGWLGGWGGAGGVGCGGGAGGVGVDQGGRAAARPHKVARQSCGGNGPCSGWRMPRGSTHTGMHKDTVCMCECMRSRSCTLRVGYDARRSTACASPRSARSLAAALRGQWPGGSCG